VRTLFRVLLTTACLVPGAPWSRLPAALFGAFHGAGLVHRFRGAGPRPRFEHFA
jgi:hypothetical protein